jgi:hypothetical protein
MNDLSATGAKPADVEATLDIDDVDLGEEGLPPDRTGRGEVVCGLKAHA